ncbi:MAG TPA: isoprenylcysteine carboxylmethyltransferase family protein [Caulobacteraceae bacterium]|jgi:protein-S-isoprenylcysteine O-methyltransferase Ste14
MLMARAFAGSAFLFAVILIVPLGAAGTWRYPEAWWLFAVFSGSAGTVTIWLWGHDKALLQRRVKAGPGSEADPTQNVVQTLAAAVFLASFAVPGLDRRFGWTHVPVAVVIAGDALVALGFLIVFLVFRANSFAAGTIEAAEGQAVIDTGPYAAVRHPMYAGALVMFAGIPLALGSWWGLLPAAVIVPVLVWRLTREEAFLAANLPGYADYRTRLRWRLVPYVW